MCRQGTCNGEEIHPIKVRSVTFNKIKENHDESEEVPVVKFDENFFSTLEVFLHVN